MSNDGGSATSYSYSSVGILRKQTKYVTSCFVDGNAIDVMDFGTVIIDAGDIIIEVESVASPDNIKPNKAKS